MDTNMTLNDRIERYFGQRLGWGPVRVREARALTGGISRDTLKVALEVGPAGAPVRRDIIVRMDPKVSLLQGNRPTEYALFCAFDGVAGVPVPKMLCNEDDPSHLGASFMASDVVPGVADISAIVAPPYAAVGPRIAREHFRVLGAITRLDPADKQLDRVLVATRRETAAADALAHWERILRGCELGPAPITAAAIRHLKRHMPPPAAKVCVVHGDYRLGNCLYLPDGTVSAVLDWEMGHLGDPLEDLAWALHPGWRPAAAAPELVAGHLTEHEAIRAWEAAAGLAADPAALAWWRLYACVKATVIFTCAGDRFVKSPGVSFVYALNAWFNLDNEEARMMDWMGVAA